MPGLFCKVFCRVLQVFARLAAILNFYFTPADGFNELQQNMWVDYMRDFAMNELCVCLCCVQEFMSSACIEHLDFLDLNADVERTFRTFQEKDKGKHYRSLTEIPKLVKMEMEEAWSKDNVIISLACFFKPVWLGLHVPLLSRWDNYKQSTEIHAFSPKIFWNCEWQNHW